MAKLNYTYGTYYDDLDAFNRDDGLTVETRDGIIRFAVQADGERAHWTATRGGTRLGRESLAILDLFQITVDADLAAQAEATS